MSREGLEQEVDSYAFGYKHGKIDGFRNGLTAQWPKLLAYIILGSFISHMLWALISLALG